MNRLTALIRREIKKFENTGMENKLKNLSNKDNSLWKYSKSLTKGYDNKIPTLHGPNGLVFTDSDKAEVLAEAFKKNHILTQDFGDEDHEKLVETKYEDIINSSNGNDEIKFISSREITSAIRHFKPRKAPGKDGIQNILLKNLPIKALVQLTNIFNACLRLAYFPNEWKEAHVLAFRKPGKDSKFPQNYRPISLLPTLGKLFVKMILNRIMAHEKENKLIIPEQFGFQPNRSTVQQLARITNHISHNFNINKSTAMVLLDIEKAFDTVWHKGLVYKLDALGIPRYLVKTTAAYLRDRTFKIIVDSTHSQARPVEAGVS